MTDKAQSFPQSVGFVGLPHWGGYLAVEWDKRLTQYQTVPYFRKMAEGNTAVKAALKAWESLVKANGYRLVPATEEEDAEREATYVEECFDDMDGSMSDTFGDIFSCRPYGFSLLWPSFKHRNGSSDDPELDSRYSDGRVGWKRWAIRWQETITRWDIDENGVATAAVQVAPPNYKEIIIPLDGAFHFKPEGRRGSPEGLSVLRAGFDAWFRMTTIQTLEAIAIERGFVGIPRAKMPAAKMQDGNAEYAAYQSIVTNIRRDEMSGLVLPSDPWEGTSIPMYEIDLLSPGDSVGLDPDKVITRYERDILRSLLSDWMTLGDTGVGSYAQSVNRTDIFLQSVKGELQSIEDVINQKAIRQLYRLNGLSPELAPRFEFRELTRRNIAEFADAIVALTNAGFVDPTDADTRETVYAVLDLPMPDESDEDREAEGEQVETETETQAPPPAADTEDADVVVPVPAKVAAEFVKFVEDDGTLTLTDAIDIMTWFDSVVPKEYRGLLDAKIVGTEGE
jgi:hypothetical protein